MLAVVDLGTRLVAALGFGALIGFERQWRARTAGLRTNALVSLGAALFVVMGAYSFTSPDADPTRVAAQVVSGIGFLGAGVIMRQGASVSGLNTAATLWASAAVGALAGGGLVVFGAAGTAMVILANVVLRPIGRTLDRRLGSAGREKGADVVYTFEVRCAREYELSIRAIVFDAVHRPDLTVRSVAAADLPDGLVVITVIALSRRRDDHEIELAIADVIRAPEVLAVRWDADELSAVD